MNIMQISEITKKNIENCVGLDFQTIINMDIDREIEYVSHKNNKPVVFSTKRSLRRIGRGNPLIARRKLRLMSYVEKKLSRMK